MVHYHQLPSSASSEEVTAGMSGEDQDHIHLETQLERPPSPATTLTARAGSAAGSGDSKDKVADDLELGNRVHVLRRADSTGSMGDVEDDGGVGYARRGPGGKEDDDDLPPWVDSKAYARTRLTVLGLLERRPIPFLWRLLKGPNYPPSPPRYPITVEPLKPLPGPLRRLHRLDSFIWGISRNFNHPLVLVLFCIAWLIGFSLLVRQSWFVGSIGDAGVSPAVIGGTSTYWTKNDGCGINGTYCEPFDNSSFVFRCPASTKNIQVLNYRAIGALEVIYNPFIIGGSGSPLPASTFPSLQNNSLISSTSLVTQPYRSDSFICQAALHAGLFPDTTGGCGILHLVGTQSDFVGGSGGSGLSSFGFLPGFPSSFVFELGRGSGSGCKDLRNEILIFNVLMSFVFLTFLRPGDATVFWVVLVCMGFWHISLVSDPRGFPPVLSDAFGLFLPTLFVSYVLWRCTFRWVLPSFRHVNVNGTNALSLGAGVGGRAVDGGRKLITLVLERSVYYLGPFWVGVLMNETLEGIPIDRLTPSDIRKHGPGGLIAVIVIAFVLLIVVLNQVRVIRQGGWLPFYLRWYLTGLIVIVILSQLPGLNLRIHHYIVGLILIPGTAFPTRLSAIYQSLLMGIFLNGVARWGYDSILQTSAELQRDAAFGTGLPNWSTDSSNFVLNGTDLGSTLLSWQDIPEDQRSATSLDGSGWDGFSILLDDVLRWTGNTTSVTLSALGLGNGDRNGPAGGLHYLRLAYQLQGTAGDFTKAATLFLGNGTWINPVDGDPS